MVEPAQVLRKLLEVIEERKSNPPEKSYTAQLLAGGVVRIGKKLLEESREVVEAAGEPGEDGRQHVVRESADLLYHLLVMMAYRDVSLLDVEAELSKRFGISGIDEKEARSKPGS